MMTKGLSASTSLFSIKVELNPPSPQSRRPLATISSLKLVSRQIIVQSVKMAPTASVVQLSTAHHVFPHKTSGVFSIKQNESPAFAKNAVNGPLTNAIARPAALPPHQVIDSRCVWYWQDKSTTAEGWIVIDATAPQVAGGGLFLHEQATFEEVRDIACAMRSVRPEDFRDDDDAANYLC